VPDTEFDECMNKAAAVINALKIADGGLEWFF
jgi:anthranilate synthase component 1